MKEPRLSILFVSAEVDPYATKAGLAQVAGSLPQAIKDLANDEIDIRVIMPKYSNQELRAVEKQEPFSTVVSGLRVPFGGQEFDIAVQRDDRYGVTTYFVDSYEFFGCDDRIYWPPEAPGSGCEIEIPNIKRFAFFSRSVLETLKRLEFRPDVIHCNDWHTALIPVYLRTLYGEDGFCTDRKRGRRTGSILTLHNVGRGFQSIWPANRKPDILELAGLAGYTALYDLDSRWGLGHSARPMAGYATEINLLKGGIIYADRVNTVSPTYAQEMLQDPVITGSEGWCGEKYGYEDNLVAFLQHHQGKLSGIVNGLDYKYRGGEQPKGWDPEKDDCITQSYTAADLDEMAGQIPNKNECKRELQKMTGLAQDESIPLIGMVGRLEPQKGVLLLLNALEQQAPNRLKELGIQILVCGRPGEDNEGRRIKAELARYAGSFSASGENVSPYDGCFSDWVRADMTFVPEKFMRQLFAGCDMILMPSEYEPCGMPQLQGHRYGAIPIVRRTGGLADTVTDGVDGFLFESDPWGTDGDRIRKASQSMLDAIERAVATYKGDLKRWGDLVRNAMGRDHTWAASAQQYIDLYRSI
ncbi:MAG: glycogen synthase [Anaerolineae bacterium]|nr:glycogen synthase [Anaerolineae bacterium]